MKISQRIIRFLCLFGLWLGLGLQAHAQTDTVTYVYTDPQGTPLVKADASGNVIARYDYTPYGNAVTSLGSPPNGPGYTGHVNDPETGLVYMQQRYYDPATGRFQSTDPISPTPGNVFNFNRYDYTNNNPINHTDPDGRCSDADGSCGRMVAAQGAYAAAHPNQPLSPIAKVGLGAMLTASGAGPAVRLVGAVRAVIGIFKGSSSDASTSSPKISKAYVRPSGTPTAAQRASVQGKPCVDCGITTARQVADHKTPLVQEYYETGTVNMSKAKSTDAVQPQCPTCSARQGAEMSRYSRAKKVEHGLNGG